MIDVVGMISVIENEKRHIEDSLSLGLIVTICNSTAQRVATVCFLALCLFSLLWSGIGNAEGSLLRGIVDVYLFGSNLIVIL